MEAPEISAKQGVNIQAVLDDIVDNVPPPQGDPGAPLQALVFDSQYDSYRGVIVLVRVMQGTLRRDMEVSMMATGAKYKVINKTKKKQEATPEEAPKPTEDQVLLTEIRDLLKK